MATQISPTPETLKPYCDAEGFIPTRTTDTAEDWGFDRDSREWMLFVRAAVKAVKEFKS